MGPGSLSDRWLGSKCPERPSHPEAFTSNHSPWAHTSVQGHEVLLHIPTLQVRKQRLRATLGSGQIWLGTQVCCTDVLLYYLSPAQRLNSLLVSLSSRDPDLTITICPSR